jgi:acyl dehydratase
MMPQSSRHHRQTPSEDSMPRTRFDNLADLEAKAGTEIAVSDWLEITQARVDRFAEATDDHQWIHVDPERAKRDSPYGGTIAHGYLTLSLIAGFMANTVEIGGTRMGVNYGTNRVRFTDPVPVGSRIRARIGLAKYETIPGGAQLTWNVTIEREGSTKPAMVAETVSRRYT